MKHLLIVYHTQSGNTGRLAAAVRAGATSELVDDVEVRYLLVREAAAEDLLWADGLLLGTPENFGYMSGAMKDFFDRTFDSVEGRILSLPYAVFISAGNDGTGALNAIRRIANGYPFKEVQDPVIAKGELTDEHLASAHDLGLALAAGLEANVF